MQDMLREGDVVADLKNGKVVPKAKKGYFIYFDKWCGTKLLGVVGKVLDGVIQERLQGIEEHAVPESHSGFRKETECCDIIFVSRQML